LKTNETFLLGGSSVSRPLPAMVQPQRGMQQQAWAWTFALLLKQLMRMHQNSKHLLLTNARVRHRCRQRSHTPSSAASCARPLAGCMVIQLPASYSAPQRSRQPRRLQDNPLTGPGFVLWTLQQQHLHIQTTPWGGTGCRQLRSISASSAPSAPTAKQQQQQPCLQF